MTWSVNSIFLKLILHTQNIKPVHVKYIWEYYHKKLDTI